MAPRVLVSDSLSPSALQIFAAHGLEADFRPDLGRDRAHLLDAIGDYDALAIRSATRVDADLLARAGRLRVVGRAGVGVDNVDVGAATAHGVVVMNTPYGNSVTTAEHTIALMMALARQIPAADASTRAGKWEKSRFMGVELAGKTLGVIGCGNVGANVATRALGLAMRVIAFDPFLTPERAEELGVEPVALEALLARADIVTLHTPLTARTRHILNAESIARMKRGARIVNCARGGLVDEAALAAALDAGHVAGAALDVFEIEPAGDNPLFARENVVCTPHLGASTVEAQEKVALQIAQRIADFLTRGEIVDAVNFPSVNAEEAPRLAPYIALAERLGAFVGQTARGSFEHVSIIYEGAAAARNVKALTAAALAGLLRPILSETNMVSAPVIAKERGVVVDEVTRSASGDYESLITLTAWTKEGERSLAGTVFHDDEPRIVAIDGVRLETAFAPRMIFVSNEDRPGFMGLFAGLLGEAGVNIATCALGRDRPGGSARALVGVDEPAPERAMARIAALPGVRFAAALEF
ncbi:MULTISPECIES: phosphoglycerate dehydrogenase [Methylosinus]|uniref:D-3-phosphoglycerate dehydrogenase n=1 Tax=Methylosinus trichosporium (strain ATCC 35070 / NCIMB 11131 / UNIQEM 75 / OB3b) TaxID=595536 RepID=A0A2D2CZZ2_METT3|nr:MULTISPECIES: phosphoglycerate dehydrogenase [Methylosinus]ATQ68321.1 phosphoglycerate dehydrogenase [Methylosinus trichosporium OB3b]OBS50940.1 phosphoglycerate dehydrogenase [Methylosinus sp. 3S-1]